MKKIITSITIVALVIIYLPACKKSSDTQQQQTTLQKIQCSRLLQSGKYLLQNAFSVPIKGSNNYIHFTEDGKVYFTIDQQRFDITQLHQQYRLCSIQKLIQSAR